jgi:tetratricopeptide (TPR) repeat protein
MSKRFIIGALVLLLAGIGLTLFLASTNRSDRLMVSAQEMAAFADASGQTNVPTQAVLAPLDLSQPVRLAIGGLGLADDHQNQQLGDLLTVALTGAPGLNLVERQSLNAVLQELNLSLSGFVRAKDAVRVGKLLKADWFLLGREAKLNDTNSLVIRVVDARTGVMRDAGVVLVSQSTEKMAADVAAFVRQSRQNAASAKTRVYLAVGTFEDLSLNNRQQANFPTQVRGYLTAAYQGGNVTLLEREYVDTLLQEVRLDLAGLTEDSGTNPPPPLQSAFWLVTGQYQSYETTNLQVEVNLDIRRIFGTTRHYTLRGLPGEPVGRQIKAAVDEAMNQNTEVIALTRVSEASAQMLIGQDLCGFIKAAAYGRVLKNDSDLVLVRLDWNLDPQQAARQKRNIEEAMHAFETVLLLEPANREAKMYLAACLRDITINNLDEARNYYRQIIEEPKQDKWSELARKALIQSFMSYGSEIDSEGMTRWFESALAQTTNASNAEFYRKQAETAGAVATIERGDTPQAEEIAEQRLFESIKSFRDFLQKKPGAYNSSLSMYEYTKMFGSDSATAGQKLAQLLPKMKSLAPELEPYLLAEVVLKQEDGNAPVVAEFQRSLTNYIEHPDRVLDITNFWQEVRLTVYPWCFEKTNYPLAVNIMEGERQAAAEGYVDFDDQEKIKLAYAYLAVERWQDALDIFESFGNKPLHQYFSGPWGARDQLIWPDKQASYCRQKLGLAVNRNPRAFDMGKPLLCLCAPSTFIADDNGLWVGIGDQLLHLDFDLKTNLAIKLPIDDSVPITALCLTASNIWIGTQGAGLIDFDKASRQSHRLTQVDGLMMDDLASLEVAGDSLWIGYSGGTGGGLGQLDLRSQKLNSFMPSLNADTSARVGEGPPRAGIGKIVAGTDGDLWMSVNNAVRQFHVTRGTWETLPNQSVDLVTCFAADSERLVTGGGITMNEIEISSKPDRMAPTNQITKTRLVVSTGEMRRLMASFQTNGNHQYISGFLGYSNGGRPKGGLAFQSLRDHRWQNLEDAVAIPNPPSTMTLDGNNLWVGGEGFIALVDLAEGKVRKFCHIQASGVDRIQIAGGYVWAQFDWHLYRAPLSALQ